MWKSVFRCTSSSSPFFLCPSASTFSLSLLPSLRFHPLSAMSLPSSDAHCDCPPARVDRAYYAVFPCGHVYYACCGSVVFQRVGVRCPECTDPDSVLQDVSLPRPIARWAG